MNTTKATASTTAARWITGWELDVTPRQEDKGISLARLGCDEREFASPNYDSEFDLWMCQCSLRAIAPPSVTALSRERWQVDQRTNWHLNGSRFGNAKVNSSREIPVG
jgi:hypothetical protein